MLQIVVGKKIFILSYIVCCFCLFLSFSQGGVVNNGDYGRVTHSMAITTEGFKPLNKKYTIQKKADAIKELPTSSLGIIGYSLYKITYFWGGKEINVDYIKIFLYLLFLIGLTLLVKDSYIFFDLIINISLTFVILSYGFLMNSLYEEAIVIAIVPILIYSLKKLINQQAFFPFLFFSSILIASKSQMLFVLPLILLPFFLSIKPRNRHKILFSCAYIFILSFSYVVLSNFVYKGVKEANNYNRFYNGIGYSVQDVASWPANHFHERLDYFYTNQKILQIYTNKYFSKDIQNLAGTSYWPTGDNMRKSINDISTSDSEKDVLKNKIEVANSKNYINMYFTNPQLIYSVSKNAIMTAFHSEISLKYLRNPNEVSDAFTKSSILMSANLYKLIVLINIVIFFYLYKRFFLILCALYVSLGFPIFVVLGDGYYEFEKHIVPYIILYPFFCMILYYLTTRNSSVLERQS